MSPVDLADEVSMRQGGERLPCLLLIDTSGSMSGDRIDQVNAGLRLLKEGLMKGDLTRVGVEIAVVTFDNEIKIQREFDLADNFEPPVLTAQGLTYLGKALLDSVNLIKERLSDYREMGIPPKRPLLFIISDGIPEGEPPQLTQQGSDAVRKAVADKKLVVWPLVVGTGIETSQLSQLTGGKAKRIDEARWADMWEWLSMSLTVMSSSKPGTQALLPSANWSYEP